MHFNIYLTEHDGKINIYLLFDLQVTFSSMLPADGLILETCQLCDQLADYSAPKINPTTF